MACKVENGTPAGVWCDPVYEKKIETYPHLTGTHGELQR
jgi:hypothetical protein